MKTISLVVLWVCLVSTACTTGSGSHTNGEADGQPMAVAAEYPRQSPFIKRTFKQDVDGQWIGNAICYGPYRDGQSPGDVLPTREQMLEDLRIMSRHWRMLRMYGSQDVAEEVLELIREHGIQMKVMVGAWVASEVETDSEGRVVATLPEAVESNRAEVDEAIRLANKYPDIVTAVTVGNETQVFWSFHKVRTHVLIGYIRQVRAQTTVPVSTSDVFTFWNGPQSKAVADEVDFIVTHIYAMWNKQTLDDTMDWTRNEYAIGVKRHPDHLFVLGEAGWATTVRDEGEQAELIIGEASEDAQQRFYRDYIAWTTAEKIPNFYFEAFDENWKGSDHPDEVEKHWGLFNTDRTPKKAMRTD